MKQDYQFLKDVSSFPYPEPGDTALNFVPKGWQEQFLKTCACIEEAFRERDVSSIHFRFDQIKEKFGMLRIYWHIDYDCANEMTVDSLNEICSDLINELENDSADLCIECGKKATRQSIGWVMPFCDECATRRNNEQNARHKTNVELDVAYPKS